MKNNDEHAALYRMPPDSDEVNASRRAEELAKLLPLWPTEIEDGSLAGRRRLVRRLDRALREERLRGRSGHWAYDLARHHQLARLWRAEVVALQRLERAAQRTPPKKNKARS